MFNEDDLAFDNELERSFRCDSEQTVSMKKLPVANITKVEMNLEDWRVQAFEFRDHEDDFGQCE